MPTTLPTKKSRRLHRQSADAATERNLLGASVFVALAFCVLTALLPAQLVLPAVGVVVILAGLILGLSVLVLGRLSPSANTGMLDMAGVLALFGFAVAIVSDKSEALRLLSALP